MGILRGPFTEYIEEFNRREAASRPSVVINNIVPEEIHIIYESRADYEERKMRERYEQNRQLKFILTWFWYVISSALFAFVLTSFSNTSDLLNNVFLFFMALFVLRAILKYGVIRAYICTLIGIFYSIIGLLYIPVALAMGKSNPEYLYFGLFLALIFFYVAYREINNNTNLIRLIKIRYFR